jgi:hypothetical protein
LVDAGVDTEARSNRGLTAALFAHWIGNPRIKSLFALSTAQAEILARLKACSREDSQVARERRCLFVLVYIRELCVFVLGD